MKKLLLNLTLILISVLALNTSYAQTFDLNLNKKIVTDMITQREFLEQTVIYHPNLELYNKENISIYLDAHGEYLVQFQQEIQTVIPFNKTTAQKIIDNIVKIIIQEYLNTTPLLEKNAPKNTPRYHGWDPSVVFGIGDPCINPNFENCDFTGWDLFVGNVDNNPYGFVNATPSTAFGTGFPANGSTHHNIVNSGTQDPYTPIIVTSPLGGNCVAMLGDGNGAGKKAESMEQIFLVDTNTNSNYTFAWAAVLEDPSGHTLGEKPYFMVRMYDASGASIPCAEYDAVAGDGKPGWLPWGSSTANPDGEYKDWTIVFIPLNAYHGQNVKVVVTVGDCDRGAHAGYAYFDSQCVPPEIIVGDTVFCAGSSSPITLTAPPGANSYLWQPGGQTTQVITVTQPGNYTVTMTASSGCSQTLLTNVSFTIGSVIADFSAPVVCVGTPTSFTDLSTSIGGPILSWEWDFQNDGVVDDTASNPTFTFPTAGTYNVHLTVSIGTSCVKDTIIPIVVIPTANADFSFSTECFGTATTFTDNSTGNGSAITIWQWDFQNDGIVDNTTQNPSYIFPTAGTYTVELYVSAGGGCADSITHVITVNPIPVANFTGTSVCQGVTSTFTDSSTISSGTITNWAWLFGDAAGGSSNIQNPTYTYAAAGTYTVTLVVTSDSGCIHTFNTTVEVWPNPVANFSNIDACVGGVTQFTDLSTIAAPDAINQWDWTFNPGLGTSNIQSPTITYTSQGSYSTLLQVTTSNGCTDTITLPVLISPYPIVNFGPDTAGCDPVCVTMTNSSSISAGTIASFTWDFGDGSSASGATPNHCFRNQVHSGIMEYDITLTAISDKGCITTEIHPQAIVVWPIPLAHFEISPEITDIYQPEITFTDLSIIAATWDWNFGDSTYSTDTNPIHEYQDTGFYTVTLYIENVYGCKDTTDKIIRIRPAYAIWIPNVFTPNKDGTNDFFYIDGYGIKEVDLYIFDRWGLQLLHDVGTDHTKVVWNGLYKGNIVQTDTYVYKAKVKDIFDKYHNYIGRVSVLK